MKLKGFYDGAEFSKFCIINKVTPTLSAPRENTFLSNKMVDGANFYRTRLGQLKIVVDITIKYDIMHNLDNLNKIFATDSLKKLSFSDRPDQYVMAIVDGDVTFTSRFFKSEARITFISDKFYWRATEGYIETPFTGESVIVENKGTSKTKPTFDVNFKSDCGYFSIVSPNGYLSFGNPKQVDNITVPDSELALNEELDASTGGVSSWTPITNAEAYILDYIKMSSAGTASTDKSGLILNTGTLGTDSKWHGHAYMKSFAQGKVDQTADNFELKSRVDMANMNGTSNTCALLIVVMDENNNHIMTTSVYDVLNGKNELTVTFKIPDASNPKKSKIIHTGKLLNLNGYIKMNKRGNLLEWEVYSDKTVVVSGSSLRVGQKVHIKRTCTNAETGHPIKKGYHDLTYTIGAIKTGKDGTKAYRMDNGGWPIYWIYERDIVETTKTVVNRTPKTIRYSTHNNQIAQMKASKVFIWQAKWGNTQPYSQFVLNSVVVRRMYNTNFIDVKNVFAKGDHLYINNENGEVLLNGSNATGLLDIDSRFFDIGGGPTQLQIDYSDWALVPEVIVTHESRWLS